MKKYNSILVVMFLFVCAIAVANFTSKTNTSNANDINQDIISIETKKYAIYASNIIENNPGELNKYVHYNRNINVQFPQIYYSNDNSDYDMDTETLINKLLFALSFGNNDNFLVSRDTREMKEYYSNYTITKADDDLFSMKYYGHLYSLTHAKEFCYGITINADTGEMREITDFVAIDENLVKNLENDSIKYYSSPMYDKDFVIKALSEYIGNYSTLPNKNTSFFVTKDSVNLIIPVSLGNSNYIILEIQ